MAIKSSLWGISWQNEQRTGAVVTSGWLCAVPPLIGLLIPAIGSGSRLLLPNYYQFFLCYCEHTLSGVTKTENLARYYYCKAALTLPRSYCWAFRAFLKWGAGGQAGKRERCSCTIRHATVQFASELLRGQKGVKCNKAPIVFLIHLNRVMRFLAPNGDVI